MAVANRRMATVGKNNLTVSYKAGTSNLYAVALSRRMPRSSRPTQVSMDTVKSALDPETCGINSFAVTRCVTVKSASLTVKRVKDANPTATQSECHAFKGSIDWRKAQQDDAVIKQAFDLVLADKPLTRSVRERLDPAVRKVMSDHQRQLIRDAHLYSSRTERNGNVANHL